MKKKRIQNVYKSYTFSKYSNRWSRSSIGNRFIELEIVTFLKNKIIPKEKSLNDKKILEVGCAGGSIINLLIRLGAKEENINGIDIRKNRLNDCKKRFPNSEINYMDARKLNFDENYFDIITVFTFFSSLLNENYQNEVSKELIRVLKPKGLIVFYDLRYNNPFNPNVVGITKSRLNDIFKNKLVDYDLLTLIPPLARSLGTLNYLLYKTLSYIPFLKSHYFAIIQK